MFRKKICSSVLIAATVATAAQIPARANNDAGSNTSTVQAFLSTLAANNGMVSTNSMFIKATTGHAPVSYAQAVNAVHSLPTLKQYSNATHVADPTAAELSFVQEGATDGDGNPIADATPGLLFGSLSAADETITGMLDDLTTMAPLPDPTLDPSLTTVVDPTLSFESGSAEDPFLRKLRSKQFAAWQVAGRPDLYNDRPMVVAQSQVVFGQQNRSGYLTRAGNSASGDAMLQPLPLACDDAAPRLVALGDLGACMLLASPAFLEEKNVGAAAGHDYLQGHVCNWQSLKGLAAVYGSDDLIAADRAMQMSHGTAFIVPRADLAVETPAAVITIKKGIIVEVEVDRNVTKVRVCTGVHGVSIRTAQAAMKLSAGEEAILATGSAAAPVCDGVAKRHVQTAQVSTGGTVTLSEFSIASMMRRCQPALALLNSHQPEHRQLVASILKSAAVLQTVTSSHGRYRAR